MTQVRGNLNATPATAEGRRLILGVPASEVPWLLYLGFLFLQPIFDPNSDLQSWLLILVAMALFIPLYGWTHRVLGARDWLFKNGTPGALLGIAGMFAFVLIGTPFTPAASTFAVYAGAAAAKLTPRSHALKVMGAVMLGLAAAFLLSPTPLLYRIMSFVPAVIVTPLVGLSVLFDSERRAANAKLRMAQEKVEQLATIAERERIARDLHDLLGHTLSTITLKSELAAALLERDPKRAATEIRDVERLSRQTLAQVRSAVKGYRSAGLTGELANAKLALKAAGVKLDYYLAPLALKPEAESILALALREGATNVVRHASAERCRVTLDSDADFVWLSIEDDGQGAAGEEPGSGLLSMRERARALGGSVKLSAPHHFGPRGTRLTMKLPAANTLERAPNPQATLPAVTEAPATT